MKQMFPAVMEANPRPLDQKQSVKGCKKCREEGIGEHCLHCSKCGQQGHFSRGCRTTSENGQGLLRQGQQYSKNECPEGKVYHQGYLDEESCTLTAFITPWRLFEWIRIPFGLSSAPAEFQRSMEHYLADLRDTICFPYLDDNLVHSHSFEEHLEHICVVLQHYMKHGVKLTPKKCDLFKSSVRFLGDKGYPLTEYLVTPLANPATEQERRFNTAHIRTRSTVERCIGLLKGRWLCLGSAGGALLYSPQKSCDIILASGVLHNIAQGNGVPDDVQMLLEERMPREPWLAQPHMRAVQRRQELVDRF
ncbi:Retrovirus-related Pol poly from transposon [Labeo rohita]|uniref:ribonuclease H n=1 Tax=Labeo rohita TaxID=84645 RepID=A0A498M6F1_LABRO|nr:Retrovirus-related Pol poly from transposon [Labeo rohita]